VKDGHYALSWHVVPVYARSLVRLLSPIVLFLIPLAGVSYRRGRLADLFPLTRYRPLLLSMTLLAVSIVPYSFLTYLNHIPSRNTYLPSVGLACAIGILFAALLQWTPPKMKPLALAFLAFVVLGNSLYIWVKKEPQFSSRAAPTRALLERLRAQEFSGTSGPIYVCGFPLHVSVAETAVAGFAPIAEGHVVFQERCDDVSAETVLQWEPAQDTYTLRVGSASSQ
jgi:hypothetical protein